MMFDISEADLPGIFLLFSFLTCLALTVLYLAKSPEQRLKEDLAKQNKKV